MEIMNKNSQPPTLGNSFGHGWNVMSKHFLVLFLVIIILGIVSIPANIPGFKLNTSDLHSLKYHDWPYYWRDMNLFTPIFFSLWGLFALAYSLMVIPVFRYGSKMMFLEGARDIHPDFNWLIQGFKENYLNIVLANLLSGALVIIGFVLCFFPGIFIACRLAFVGYLVMDRKLDPVKAVEESWKMTKGHGWTIFFMAIISFFIAIAGLCLCFVGIFPASIWIDSSFASLYEFVLVTQTTDQQQEV